MVLLPILVDVRNAYEAHDRDALERCLLRLQDRLVGSARTPLHHQDPVSLQRTRDEMETNLRAVLAEQKRRAEAGHAEQRQARAKWERELLTFPARVHPST